MTERDDILVRRAVDEIWNRGALELADVLFATAYVNHGGLIPDLVHGPEAIKAGVALLRTAFPGLHIAIDDLVADGATIVLRWTARAAPPDSSIGSDTPGPRGELNGSTRVRFSDGQIVESWTDWDQGAAFERLGLMSATSVR